MDNPADFDHLLLWLGQGTGEGARQYIELRQKLVAIFRFKGCGSPEEFADETLDRAAKAIARPGFLFEGKPIAYLRGIARNVYLESTRKEKTVSQESTPGFAERLPAPESGSGTERLYDCLERCLAKMPGNGRSLLLRYYQGEKSAKIDGRARLAQQEGLSLNSLRLKIFRLREAMRRCVETCTKINEIEVRF